MKKKAPFGAIKIVIDSDGRVLDGVLRAQAALSTGIEIPDESIDVSGAQSEAERQAAIAKFRASATTA